MFEGLSAISFDELRLHVEVSRVDRSACILTPDHSDVCGILARRQQGAPITWHPTQPKYKLPAEVLDVIATMI